MEDVQRDPLNTPGTGLWLSRPAMEFGRMNRIPPILNPFRWNNPALAMMNDWDELDDAEKTRMNVPNSARAISGAKTHPHTMRHTQYAGEMRRTDATRTEERTGKLRRCDKLGSR